MNATVPTRPTGVSIESLPFRGAASNAVPMLDLPSPFQVDMLVAQWKSVSKDFVDLLERYRSEPLALRHFGIINWHTKKLDVAIEAFSAALALSPDDPRLWADLAGIYDGSSRVELAEICMRRALELDPRPGRYWQMLASLLDRRGARDEAESAYLEALRVEPMLGDAHFGLGILRFHRQRVDEAASSLRAAIANGYSNALGYSCLGHVLYRTSDFAGCAMAFEEAARFGPLEPNARKQFARARTLATMVEGRIDDALNAYPELAGEDREDLSTILLDAFSLLSAHGHRAAAIEVGRRRLAEKPDDPIQRYLLDAVAGLPLKSAPIDYIESYFDRFAPQFDQKLVGILQYHTPEQLKDLIAKHRSQFANIVDLGCGTGLGAEPLASFGGTLMGVDVSSRMLEEAAKRNRYTSLVKAEVVAHLHDHPAEFDLIFAADLFVYIGDLAPLMRSASQALVSAGILALNIERGPSGDFTLLPSGRFAHSIDYVERLAGPDFEILDRVETMIRLEANRPVEGYLVVLRRR